MSKILTLEELVSQGIIEMSRGSVISKEDIKKDKGKYPIYSSSVMNDGLFGHYGKFMFDEELVSWSVDGGGDVFYRPKHKFSITNVSGYIRVLKKDVLDVKYLALSMMKQKQKFSFDYAFKAHPSVIAPLYSINIIPLKDQEKISSVLLNLEKSINSKEIDVKSHCNLKISLINKLLNTGLEKKEVINSEIGEISLDWKVVNMTDVSSIDENNISEKDGLNNFEYISIGDIKDNKIIWDKLERFKSLNEAPSRARRVVEKNNILYSSVRPNLKQYSFIEKDVRNTLASTGLINIKSKIDPYFLYTIVQSDYFYKQVMERVVGGNYPAINSSDFKTIQVKVSKNPIEMEKIGKIFKNLDDIIFSKQEELEKLKQLKKGLLNKLL